MTYSAEISRANPSLFVFMIDQSGSMTDPFGSGDSSKNKGQVVADVINRLLQNLIIRCAKTEGVRDYFDVSVLGYSENTVYPAFGGVLSGREVLALSEVALNPLRVEERTKKVLDGVGGLVDQTIRFPVWFDPKMHGGTPMCEAFRKTKSIVENWLEMHKDCYPPTVIHITDGESTDGDITYPAQSLRQLSSSDGNVLLYNIHLSSHPSSPIEFPDSEDSLPDDYARLLFKISSTLPETTRSIAASEGYSVSEKTKGFTFNADNVALIRFLEIGTRPSNLR